MRNSYTPKNINLSHTNASARSLIELFDRATSQMVEADESSGGVSCDTIVNLSNNKIGAEGIDMIMSRLTRPDFINHFRISELDLTHTQLSDEGFVKFVRFLPKLPQLKKLRVGFNRLTVKSMLALADCLEGLDTNTCITELDLRHNDICSHGLTRLLLLQPAHNNTTVRLNRLAKQLQVLDLTGNHRISDEGLKLLSTALINQPDNQLKTLIMWGNGINDFSVATLCQSALISENCKLEVLDLTSNNLSQLCIGMLIFCLENNEGTCGRIVSLSVTGNAALKDSSLLKRLSLVLNRNKTNQRNTHGRISFRNSDGAYSIDFSKCFALLRHVKERYKHEPHVYHTFLDKMSLCANNEGVPIRNLYHQMVQLFGDDHFMISELSNVFSESTQPSIHFQTNLKQYAPTVHSASVIDLERSANELEEREKIVEEKERAVLFILQRLSGIHEFRTKNGEVIQLSVKDILGSAKQHCD